MKLRLNRSKTLLAATVAGVLVLSGCLGGAAAGRSIAAGWAGGIVTGGTLFVGSMQGRIVALDPADGTFRGEPVLLEAQLPSGGFGCVPGGTTAVAIYGSPAADGDLIYVGGYDGKVYAFVFDGSRFRQDPRWVYPRQGSVGAPIIGGVTASDGAVYFGTANGMVYALDGADGFKIWSRDIGNKIWSAPAVSGDTVFVGSFDKHLYALDAEDGSDVWDEPFETGGTITSTPTVADGTVYFGSFDRFFYALEASSGRLLWRFPPDDEAGEVADMPQSWYWTSPIVKDGIVYAPNLDGKVYGLNARTGAKTVEFDLGSPISSAPVLVGDTIVIATSTTNRAKRDGAVHAINTTSKQQRLILGLDENIYAPLFSDGTTVYAHTMTDNLYAIDVASGSSRKFALSADGEE